MKETHFKVISGIYPVADFMHKRFHFELEELCTFCSAEKETVEHLFFKCQFTMDFWTNMHCWVSLKIPNVSTFTVNDIIYFMDNLDKNISDTVNFVIMMGKYFIHTCKWKSTTPLFAVFLNNFSEYFKSLKCTSNLNRKSSVIYDCIKRSLLF